MTQFLRKSAAILLLAITMLFVASPRVEAQMQDTLSIHFVYKNKEEHRLPFKVIAVKDDTVIAHGMTPATIMVPRGEYRVDLTSDNETMTRWVYSESSRLVMFSAERATIVVVQTLFDQQAMKMTKIKIDGKLHEFKAIEVPKIKKAGSHFFTTLFFTGKKGDSVLVEIDSPLGYRDSTLTLEINGKHHWLDLTKEFCQLILPNPLGAEIQSDYGYSNADTVRLRVPTHTPFFLKTKKKGYETRSTLLNLTGHETMVVEMTPRVNNVKVTAKEWGKLRNFPVKVYGADGYEAAFRGDSTLALPTGTYDFYVWGRKLKIKNVLIDGDREIGMNFHPFPSLKKAAEPAIVTAALLSAAYVGYNVWEQEGKPLPNPHFTDDDARRTAYVAGGAAVLTGAYFGGKALGIKFRSPVIFTTDDKKSDGATAGDNTTEQ